MTPVPAGLLLVASVVMLTRAGVIHLREPAAFAEALSGQGLWGTHSRRLIVRLLPPVEITTAALTLAVVVDRGPRTLTAGLLLALGAGFTLVVVLLLIESPTAACGCGSRREPVGPATLLRPLALIGAGSAIAAGAHTSFSGPLAEQVVVLLSGVTAAILIDLVVATAVLPRPRIQP